MTDADRQWEELVDRVEARRRLIARKYPLRYFVDAPPGVKARAFQLYSRLFGPNVRSTIVKDIAELYEHEEHRRLTIQLGGPPDPRPAPGTGKRRMISDFPMHYRAVIADLKKEGQGLTWGLVGTRLQQKLSLEAPPTDRTLQQWVKDERLPKPWQA